MGEALGPAESRHHGAAGHRLQGGQRTALLVVSGEEHLVLAHKSRHLQFRDIINFNPRNRGVQGLDLFANLVDQRASFSGHETDPRFFCAETGCMLGEEGIADNPVRNVEDSFRGYLVGQAGDRAIVRTVRDDEFDSSYQVPIPRGVLQGMEAVLIINDDSGLGRGAAG